MAKPTAKTRKQRADEPTPRERIEAVLRDAKRPMRSLDIWHRLAGEKGQHHQGYLRLSEVRKEIRAMYRERKLRCFQPDKQVFWALPNTPLGEIAEWADHEEQARPPKREPEPPPDPADD